jgi:DNA gyrase subunit B
MHEIVERGHLYIAQPPLYKAKRGKKEIYLKDEAALLEYLLNEGVEGISVQMEKSGKVIRGKQIIPTLRNIIDYNNLFEKITHKGVNREVLRVFVNGKVQNGFADMTDLAPLAEKLKAIEPRQRAGANRPEHPGNPLLPRVQAAVAGVPFGRGHLQG